MLTTTASIVVPCKGRRHHLEQTLPLMLAQEVGFAYEVIVVDYGCPDGTAEWLRSSIKAWDRNLCCIQVMRETDVFNICRARNCGAKLVADSRVLCFADADSRLSPLWLATVSQPILAGEAVVCRPMIKRGYYRCAGCAAVERGAFHQARGYDERLRGWGHGDVDLYGRLERVGRSASYHPDGLVDPIEHSTEDSVRFYEEKTQLRSWRAKRRLCRDRDRAGRTVNPSGYGLL